MKRGASIKPSGNGQKRTIEQCPIIDLLKFNFRRSCSLLISLKICLFSKAEHIGKESLRETPNL